MDVDERQLALEEEMMEAGRVKLVQELAQAEQDGRVSEAGAGQSLLKRAVGRLIPAIEAYQHAPAHHRQRAPKYLRQIDAPTAAYLTTRTVLDLAAGRPKLQAAALRVASALQEEVEMRAFRKLHPDQYEVTDLHNRGAATDDHRRRVFQTKAHNAGVRLSWTDSDKLHLGLKLIDLAIEHTGMAGVIKSSLSRGKGQHTKILAATPETIAWLAETTDRMAFLRPPRWPMVAPPKPWTNAKDGGYLTPSARRGTRIIKSRTRTQAEVLEADAPAAIFDALNAVQSQPWRVNRKVLDVVTVVTQERLGGFPVPDLEPYELPPKPADIHTNEEARKRWKSAAADTYNADIARRGKAIQHLQTFAAAERFADEAAIYFPHAYDFRGRLYPLPTFLQPQGSDLARGLLEFGDGRQAEDMDLTGFWLAVHLANVFGEDSVSLQERAQWAFDRLDEIEDVAAYPIDHRWWTEADKPWQFLAACFEFARWCEAVRDGTVFVTHLPVQMDGSCNGLQHIAAMTRDGYTATAVNLIPNDTPQDVYGACASVLCASLEEVGSPWDLALFEVVDRKVTKRRVMTLPYGGKEFSSTKYLREALAAKAAAGAELPGTPHECAAYLRRPLTVAMRVVLPGPVLAMEALQRWARKIVAKGVDMPLAWRTPDGFPVLQSYRSVKMRRVKTTFRGSITYLTLAEEEDGIDGNRNINGFPPNFVHSYDATHERQYALRASAAGVALSLIHDSFGCHATDVPIMNQLLREAFVDLYRNPDTMIRLQKTLEADYGVELGEFSLPEGTPKFRISAVLDAEYFFA